MLEKFSTTGEESEMLAQDQAISKQLNKILMSQSKGDTYLNEMRLEEIDEDEENRTKSGASSRRQTGVQTGDGKEYEDE